MNVVTWVLTCLSRGMNGGLYVDAYSDKHVHDAGSEGLCLILGGDKSLIKSN